MFIHPPTRLVTPLCSKIIRAERGDDADIASARLEAGAFLAQRVGAEMDVGRAGGGDLAILAAESDAGGGLVRVVKGGAGAA